MKTYISFDFETTGVQWYKDDIILMAWYESEETKGIFWDTEAMRNWFLSKIKDPNIYFIAHNAKFDLMFVMSHLDLKNEVTYLLANKRVFCTHMRAFIANNNEQSYSLDILARKYLDSEKDNTLYTVMSSVFGGKAERKQMHNLKKYFSLSASQKINLDTALAFYAEQDVRLTKQLFLYQEEILIREELKDYENFELSVFNVIVRMQNFGIRINQEQAQTAIEKVGTEIDTMRLELVRLFGSDYNPNSPVQTREIFKPLIVTEAGYWKVDLDNGQILKSRVFTNTGLPSLGKDFLLKAGAMGDSRARLIYDYRRKLKLRDTFLKGHILGNIYNGRVYPNINEFASDEGGTVTNRLSYSEPALQQIPKRDPEASALLRTCFLPDENQLWYSGDLDQHEIRVFAHYLNNPKINALYEEEKRTGNKVDFHQVVADLTGLPRQRTVDNPISAKEINLGLVFGMSKQRMAQHLGFEVEQSIEENGYIKYIIPEEAEKIWQHFGDTVEGVFDLPFAIKDKARKYGFIRSIAGRKIRIGDKTPLYKIPVHLYQGSSADLNKANMVIIDKIITPLGGRLLLNIHDDYHIQLPRDLPKATVEKILLTIADEIANKIKPDGSLYCRIATTIDFGYGAANWHDALEADLITRKKND